MTEFPELQEALSKWVSEASTRLSAEGDACYSTTDHGHWQRDSDGVFRDIERVVELWDRQSVNNLFDLPSWAGVLDVIRGDDRLNRQLDTLVGTTQGSHRFETTGIGRRVLPRPNELGQLTETFERRYAELENFLAADEIEYTVIWPLPGLASAVLPVQLDSSLVLDAMSDREFGFALDTEVVRTLFPRERLLAPQAEQRTCARYRFNLPKVVGGQDVDEIFRVGEEIENRLRGMGSALEESLALILTDTIGVAGRFSIVSEPGSPLSGGVGFQQSTLPQGTRLRRTQMSDSQATELREVWQLLRQPGLLQRNKGLALTLRRLSYQAQRERPEDEMLDTMIAAEALYLTELGNEPYRGELRYRLALRAALWADPEQVGYTKSEVLGIMKSAYDARSAIAHGGTPKPDVMKVRGQRVSLEELVNAAKSVIAAGCRAALIRAVAPNGGWPPDWDALALGVSLGPESTSSIHNAHENEVHNEPTSEKA
jgi:hypothetical protein